MRFPAGSSRGFLIAAVQTFVMRVRGLHGVRRIALIGSLATPKQNTKDAEVLIWMDNGADLKPLAALARQLKGQAQSRNSGADIFVVDPSGAYRGRICHYRECRPGIRMSCRALRCGPRPHLCDDLDVLKLRAEVIQAPPVELWPRAVVHASIPQDIRRLVLAMKVNELAPPAHPSQDRRCGST